MLEDVLPERLRMFPNRTGVWLMTGSGTTLRGQHRCVEGSLFDAVRDYLVRRDYEFAIGHDADRTDCAFCVLGRRKIDDPLHGVRAIMLCGVPGSGKTLFADALLRKSARFRRVALDDAQGDRSLSERTWRAELTSAAQASASSKGGSWWWDQSVRSYGGLFDRFGHAAKLGAEGKGIVFDIFIVFVLVLG